MHETKISAYLILACGIGFAAAQDVNLVKQAYIKDSDGDGRGDKVFIVFTRPLDALPASVSPVYWNRVEAGNANTTPPVLSMLAGQANVLVADFAAAPFRMGLTSIPNGEQPYATLPGDAIFASQKPVIMDSIGPVLLSAVFQPFNTYADPDLPAQYREDTLVVGLSEPMKTSDFKQMLRTGKRENGGCEGYVDSKSIVSANSPSQGIGGSDYTFLFPSRQPGPLLAGDCVYLNANGLYTDIPGNLPATRGQVVEGSFPQAIRSAGKGRRGDLAGQFRIRSASDGEPALQVRHQGAFRVLLRSMQGAVTASVQGVGPGMFSFGQAKPVPGIHLMEIRAGKDRAERLEMF